MLAITLLLDHPHCTQNTGQTLELQYGTETEKRHTSDLQIQTYSVYH